MLKINECVCRKDVVLQEYLRIVGQYKKTPNNPYIILGVQPSVDRAELYERGKFLLEMFGDELKNKDEIDFFFVVDIIKNSITKAYPSRSLSGFQFFVTCLFFLIVVVISVLQIYDRVNLIENFVALFLAYVFVDMVTGIFHFIFDHVVPCNKNSVLGRVAINFHLHHMAPNSFLSVPLFSLVLESLELGLPITTVFIVVCLFFNANFLTLILIYFGMFGLFFEVFHACAHAPSPPNRFIAYLQKTGLILSHQHHMEHHKGNHEKNFCIFSGICNPLLNLITPYLLKKTAKGK